MSEVLRKIKNYYRREVLLDLPPGAHFMYHEDNNMLLRQNPPPLFDPHGCDVEYCSSDVIIAGCDESKRFTLVGALTAFRSLTYLILIRKATNMHSIEIRQPDIMEGETPEEVVVLKGDDWRELLIQYGELCKERNGVKDIDTTKNLTGYCTWYYYYDQVTEQNLLDNVDFMKAHKDRCCRTEIVQIDDGYQRFQGDWLEQRDSWPTPLTDIAARIKEGGMRPGIWIMPFQASTASRVYREHPDWFVKDETGQAKIAKGWSLPPDDMWGCLDMTIPDVQQHIADVFRRFREQGYTYFKMDGLGYGMMEGRRSDPNATAVSAFRQGLKAIREAVPDAHLLACSPPMMACLGLVDSVRISADTHAVWRAIKRVYVSVVARFWMFDRLFRCDPDVMIARQDRSEHTIGEARVTVLTGIMTGITLTSDNFSTILPERLELLRRGTQLRMYDVKPHNWKLDTYPEVCTGTLDGKKCIAVVNLTEELKEYRFEELSLNPEQEMEELLHPMGKRKYAITLPPHDAALLVEC